MCIKASGKWIKGVLQNNEQNIHSIIMVSQSASYIELYNVYVDYFLHSVPLSSPNNDKIEESKIEE